LDQINKALFDQGGKKYF